MARNAEVDACLDEIADSAINFNEKRQCVEIVFNEVEHIKDGVDGEKQLEQIENIQDILYKEFYKFLVSYLSPFIKISFSRSSPRYFLSILL